MDKALVVVCSRDVYTYKARFIAKDLLDMLQVRYPNGCELVLLTNSHVVGSYIPSTSSDAFVSEFEILDSRFKVTLIDQLSSFLTDHKGIDIILTYDSFIERYKHQLLVESYHYLLYFTPKDNIIMMETSL